MRRRVHAGNPDRLSGVVPFRVLTVCTANVCRSPAGAAMLRQEVARAGLAEQVEVGSAGTSWETEGMPMDPRVVISLVRAGFTDPLEHSARSVHQSELPRWDLILAFTPEHAESLRRKTEQIPEGEPRPRVLLWREFDPKAPANARPEDLVVPDPWYSGQKEFDRTISAMARAVPSILVYIRSRLRERAGA